jgi:hypothetical protein
MTKVQLFNRDDNTDPATVFQNHLDKLNAIGDGDRTHIRLQQCLGVVSAIGFGVVATAGATVAAPIAAAGLALAAGLYALPTFKEAARTGGFRPLPFVDADLTKLLTMADSKQSGFDSGEVPALEGYHYLPARAKAEYTLIGTFGNMIADVMRDIPQERRATEWHRLVSLFISRYGKVIRESPHALRGEVDPVKLAGFLMETPEQAKARIASLRSALDDDDADWDDDDDAIEVAATIAQDETHNQRIAVDTAIENLTHAERSLFLHLADNPFLCYFILASQRTGKTSSAAAASLVIKREKGTEVYYINLSDHGQGNREAFAHADQVVIGDINGGKPGAAAALIKEAIAVVEQFHQSNNAILVVDEWVNLALKVRSGMDDFWAVLSPKAAALTSNGIGCGRSVWAIAPTFQAAVMREEAKVVKSFVPLILSVAPGQSIEWSNPATAVMSRIPYNGSLVGQAARNWPDAGIVEPTPEEVRYFQRAGASRIFWADKQWSILGKAPALPKVATVDAVADQKPDKTNTTHSFQQSEDVAKLERDLASPIVTPEIDLLQICIDKLASVESYMTISKLRGSLSTVQRELWDEEFEVLLLEDDRVNWVDVPISGNRISTRLEYVPPITISE